MDFQMSKGSDEDFQSVLHILEEIGGKSIEDLKHYDLNINNNGFRVGNHFPNIWGNDFLCLDSNLYIRFAKAAPKAEWTASSLRHYDVDGSESKDKAAYSNGVLDYEYLSNTDCCEMSYAELWDWIESVLKDDVDSDGLTIEKLEECFDSVSDKVKEVFDNSGEDEIEFETFILDVDNFSLYMEGEEPEPHYSTRRYVIEHEDWTDKTFVITGKLKLFENRDEFVEYIEELGGKVVGSVSSKTDYLICNDTASTSSKMKKAKELGIPVITEEEFIRRFGDPGEFDLGWEDEEEEDEDE